jgi:hypothetical protein
MRWVLPRVASLPGGRVCQPPSMPAPCPDGALAAPVGDRPITASQRV